MYKGVIITRFRRNTIHSQEIKKFIQDTEPFIGSVRESIKVADSVYQGLPIVSCEPSHPSAIAYKAIAKLIDGINLTELEEVELYE